MEKEKAEMTYLRIRRLKGGGGFGLRRESE